MSVATRNPFALLDDDDAPAAAQTSQKKDAPAAPPTRGNAKTRGGPASRGGKYYQRGGARSSGLGDTNLNQDGIQDPVTPDRKFDGRGRGRSGGRGGGRGARGRQFDRQSQTGRTDSDKKFHQGWGGDRGETERKQEEAAATDAVAEGQLTTQGVNDSSGWGAPSGDASGWDNPDGDVSTDKPQGDRPPRREREPEEEDNTLTLDQYMAQQKEKELAGITKLEGRKVEGGDWKDTVLLQKPEEEDAYFTGKGKPMSKPRAKKEDKVFLEIDARFERPQRGGRGRGGRGGDTRGRGGHRSQYHAAAATVNVDDESAFPSLS